MFNHKQLIDARPWSYSINDSWQTRYNKNHALLNILLYNYKIESDMLIQPIYHSRTANRKKCYVIESDKLKNRI